MYKRGIISVGRSSIARWCSEEVGAMEGGREFGCEAWGL
jgi:hypothetical protein